MNKFLLSLLFLLLFQEAFAQEIITVEANNAIKDVSNHPVGINMNYLMDDDTYLQPSTKTVDAIKAMGTKFLRFPGGEKSDNYIWGQRPFTSANHTLAFTGNCYWPNNDPRFALGDFKSLQASTLDFDEFMIMAQQTGSEPLIVVNGDAHRYAPETCNGLPERDSLIVVAREWVRYANVVKKFNIKYWMIGNESYNKSRNDHATTATQYQTDIIAFASAMKAVDPTIKIIVNGNDDAWWKTVLSNPAATAYIDYLGISVYPIWNWTTGYEQFRTGSPNFTGPINTALNAVQKYVTNITDKQRIKVIATEVNAIDWGNTPWPNSNDVGHALVAFDMIGQQIKIPKLDMALLWNTRWIDNQNKTNHIYDALSSTGSLQANGLALSVWGKYLLDTLVAVNNTTNIISYASRSGKNLNIFLVNKDTQARTVNLNLNNFNSSGQAERIVFQGSSITDVNPTLTPVGSVSAVSPTKYSSFTFQAEPASITVLKISGPTNILADNFLPVTLVNFSVQKQGNHVKITWQTAVELNNSGFEVQISEDAKLFRGLSFVKSQQGSTNHNTAYSYLDQEAGKSGTRYYRLKQIDTDGKFTYSEIKAVTLKKKDFSIEINPNPVQQDFQIRYVAQKNEIIFLHLINELGQKVSETKFQVQPGHNNIKVPMGSEYLAGIYVLHILTDEFFQPVKIIKR